MKKLWVFKLTMIVIALGIVMGSLYSYLAFAGDEVCQAGCELDYKRCVRGCDGDTDCELDCSDDKDDCIQNCQ